MGDMLKGLPIPTDEEANAINAILSQTAMIKFPPDFRLPSPVCQCLTLNRITGLIWPTLPSPKNLVSNSCDLGHEEFSVKHLKHSPSSYPTCKCRGSSGASPELTTQKLKQTREEFLKD